MRPRARRAGRPSVNSNGRLHLDAEDAALRPALVLAGVGVVEDVARDERADAVLLADLLRRVHRGVDDLQLAVGECGSWSTYVATVWSAETALIATIRSPSSRSGWQTAAGADANEPLDTELYEFLDHDRGRRTAHPGRLDGDRFLPRWPV